MPIRIALIDPQLLFRECFKALLKEQSDFSLVADVSRAEDAFPLLDGITADVAIVEVTLPGSSGIALARETRRRRLRTRVVILTSHVVEEFVVDALEAGAFGYLLKSQAAEEVFEGLRSVASGRVSIAPTIANSAFEELERRRNIPHLAQGPLAELSGREHEVFELAVRNFSNREIGRHLCISIKTVETHRSNINRKLQVHSCAELIRFAARHGLLVA